MEKPSTPTVTVIIPAYNSSGTLKLSLESVLRQDYEDFEVWVVGDCCTDDSETVTRSFGDGRVHWVNLPVNSGTPAAPRNEGLKRARGKFIAYLGHDDLWFPWHLSGLVEGIEKNHSDFAYSLGALMGPQGAGSFFTLPGNPWDKKSAISPSNWLHRRSLTDAIGSWSTGVWVGDDREFLQRARDGKTRFYFHRQLSVIKYPAWQWRMYAITSDFPQTGHAGALSRDPEAFRLELLQEVAARMAGKGLRLDAAPGRYPKPLRWIASLCMDIYGRRRWPLNRLLYWQWRRASGLPRKARMLNQQSK